MCLCYTKLWIAQLPSCVVTSELVMKESYILSQITIIIYLSVVAALFLYMLFLLLVDPLIRKHDPYIQPLHNEEDSEVPLKPNACACLFSSTEINVKALNVLCVSRRCVHKRITARPGGIRCSNVLREHSNVGRSRSRSSEKLYLTATRCSVKTYNRPQGKVRVGNCTRLSAFTLSPAALLSLSHVLTFPSIRNMHKCR